MNPAALKEVERALNRKDDDRTTEDWNIIDAAARLTLIRAELAQDGEQSARAAQNYPYGTPKSLLAPSDWDAGSVEVPSHGPGHDAAEREVRREGEAWDAGARAMQLDAARFVLKNGSHLGSVNLAEGVARIPIPARPK